MDSRSDQYNDARTGGANAPSAGKGAALKPYADWIQDLPQVDTPFEGLDGRMISGPDGQAVFFRAAERFEVPPHSHGAQWGIVVTGRLHLEIEGEPATYEPGETYDIPAGAEHTAILEAGTCVIDVFQDPDRYSPK
jgi:quercetin dioxygenase-like cupin family protein